MKKQNLSILYQDDPNLLCLVREIKDWGGRTGTFLFLRKSLTERGSSEKKER